MRFLSIVQCALIGVVASVGVSQARVTPSPCERVNGRLTGFVESGNYYSAQCSNLKFKEDEEQRRRDRLEELRLEAQLAAAREVQPAPAAAAAPVAVVAAAPPTASPQPLNIQVQQPGVGASPAPAFVPPGGAFFSPRPSGFPSSDNRSRGHRAAAFFFQRILWPSGGVNAFWYLGAEFHMWGRPESLVGVPKTGSDLDITFKFRFYRGVNLWGHFDVGWQKPFGDVSSQIDEFVERIANGQKVTQQEARNLQESYGQAKDQMFMRVGTEMRIGCWAFFCDGPWKGLTFTPTYRFTLLPGDRDHGFDVGLGTAFQFAAIKLSAKIWMYFPQGGAEHRAYEALQEPRYKFSRIGGGVTAAF